MARILIKDLGVRTGKDGKSSHRLHFSYACDQMEIGADMPMAHTFLQTISHNQKTGKTYTSRDYYRGPHMRGGDSPFMTRFLSVI